MRFYRALTKEERDEWRCHPVTRLVFEMLKQELEAARRHTIQMAGTAQLTSVNIAHGKTVALETVISLLESDQ